MNLDRCSIGNNDANNIKDGNIPCVSILMPSLNTVKYIREALDSVVNQTLKNIEIICIDAGSDDGTREIIAEYAKNDDRINVIDSPIKSYGYQMNLGLAAAKGRYIGIVEPDDHVLPEMYEELYILAIRNGIDIVKGNCNFFSTANNGSIVSDFHSIFSGWNDEGERYECIFDIVDLPSVLKEGALATWSGIYRRKFLYDNQVRYNDSIGASFQDTGFFFQTALCARSFMAVKKAYYNYRVDNPSSSRNDKSKLSVLWKEYEFIFNWLSNYHDKARLEVFEPYILGRLFSGSVWLIKRCGFELAKDLVEKIKQKFTTLVATGIIRSRHMPQRDWRTLVSWTEGCIPISCSCKVSVVIPCFNVEKYVAECLDSVLSQTLNELECICVDDGSSDNTVEIIKRYAMQDSRVKLYEQPHIGVYEARNRAMREAKGEFIAFMDPDDLYPSKNVLNSLYTAAKNNGLLAAGGSYQTFTPDGKISRIQKPKNLFNEENTINFSEYQWALGYQRFIYSRILLQRLGINFPPLVRFQDPPFMASALIAAENFRTIPDFVYSYRIGYKKINWKDDNCRRFKDALKGIGMVANYAIEANLPELLDCAEDEFDAHLNRVVKPDDDMLSVCAEELSEVRKIMTRYRLRSKHFTLKEKKISDYVEPNRVLKISILKIFLPYSFVRWWVARRYSYTWPVCGRIKGVLPFCLVSAFINRVSTDRNIIKYLLPYGMMCNRMFKQYGLTEWNGVPLDGVSPRRPEKAKGRRYILPFGLILFLDKYSQRAQ